MESVHASLCERLCIPTCLSRISVRVKGRMSARIKERMSARIKERMPASVKELIPARLNHNPSNGRLQKVTTSPGPRYGEQKIAQFRTHDLTKGR